MKFKIDIIPANNINTKRWDQLVAQSENGLIYAQSSFLNAMTNHWDGMVINDYETIMPIPWKTKAGIKYAYTPPFTQQLGFIGKPIELQLDRIIKRIQASFRYGTILLNAGNGLVAKNMNATPKSNLLLNLDLPFTEIKKVFRKDHQQNAQKAIKAGLVYTENISIDRAVNFYQSIQGIKTPHITAEHFQKIINYCLFVLEPNQNCFTRAVMNQEGELLSSALFLKDEKRIYNIMNATSEIGRSEESNHLLFNQLIQEFSDKKIILDFEGSSIPGIKKFYEGFGCYEEIFSVWHYNKLPFPLSLIP